MLCGMEGGGVCVCDKCIEFPNGDFGVFGLLDSLLTERMSGDSGGVGRVRMVGLILEVDSLCIRCCG